MPYARKPEDNLKPVHKSSTAPTKQTAAQNLGKSNKVVAFKPREVDMMPGDWAEPGNPTHYELATTIQTCKRLWHLNKQALEYPDCNREATEYNILVLEKLYIILMDYLVE